ncbi:IclR family transcriptional regulator [Halogeometricum limi]|uniref:Transcriptional regulator, IclR family n=1 Tax=Halogeometricum limi TaxID=555875 RepID=A0A1I6ID90_9EURY|nr:IclR family transcriptional regulator [Halogeometricum limi]SFR64735.1 transcriptional regulator, IclR family [Halogeometricum limi]
MVDDDRGPANTVEAVERAVSVINALKDLDGAGVTELADYLGMSKSGAHKQLSTLVKTEFVAKHADEYRLCYRFVQMGEYVKTNSPLYQIGAAEVDKLAEKSNYFVYLAAMGQDHAYCLHAAEGKEAVVPNLSVGKQISLHSTAAGKAILAELPEERRSRVLNSPISSPTPNTVSDPEELAAELASIREDGVAFEDEENVPGMRGVGAPIRPEGDRVLGAVGISGPLSLLSDEHFREELPSLVSQTRNFIEVKFSLESRDPFAEGSHIPRDFY